MGSVIYECHDKDIESVKSHIMLHARDSDPFVPYRHSDSVRYVVWRTLMLALNGQY